MKIGEFARLGQVSVRMLRHYDRIGLIQPARVDPWSGHRDYAPEQLAVLHRLIALKELGLSLAQIHSVIVDRPSPEQLRGMLALRQAELASEVEASTARLAEVARRLQLIEEEPAMPTHDRPDTLQDQQQQQEFIVRALAPRRIAARLAVAEESVPMADVVEPLFVGVSTDLTRAGACAETGVALYDASGESMTVTIGYDHPEQQRPDTLAPDILLLDLDAVPDAVCGVHLGPLDSIAQSWQRLHEWLESRGWVPDGPCREIYLEAGPGPDGGAPERTTALDQVDWVTELQQPVRRAGTRA